MAFEGLESSLQWCKGESLFLEIFIRVWNLLYKGVKGTIVHSYICGGLNILYMQRL